jgi:hypothetical protein
MPTYTPTRFAKARHNKLSLPLGTPHDPCPPNTPSSLVTTATMVCYRNSLPRNTLNPMVHTLLQGHTDPSSEHSHTHTHSTEPHSRQQLPTSKLPAAALTQTTQLLLHILSVGVHLVPAAGSKTTQHTHQLAVQQGGLSQSQWLMQCATLRRVTYALEAGQAVGATSSSRPAEMCCAARLTGVSVCR